LFQDNNSDNEDNKSEYPIEEESKNKQISNDVKIVNLINKVVPSKWYSKVHIIVSQDYSFDVITLIDSGADLIVFKNDQSLANILKNLQKN
jgi:hypothetical protein